MSEQFTTRDPADSPNVVLSPARPGGDENAVSVYSERGPLGVGRGLDGASGPTTACLRNVYTVGSYLSRHVPEPSPPEGTQDAELGEPGMVPEISEPLARFVLLP